MLRAAARLLPRSLPMPILTGPNQGRRWIVGAGIHDCWRGRYERGHIEQVLADVQPGMTVFDVGAHAGYYTLAFARLVGPSGRVIAVEPMANNLRHHLRLNRVDNVSVVEAAASDQAGRARFALGEVRDARERHYRGHLGSEGTQDVRTVRLDELGVPDLIKMDIEGGEGPALAGAPQILARRPVIFLSLHGITDEAALAQLRDHDYAVTYLSDQEIVAH